MRREGQVFLNEVMIQEGFIEEVTLFQRLETRVHQTFRAGRACLKEGAA